MKKCIETEKGVEIPYYKPTLDLNLQNWFRWIKLTQSWTYKDYVYNWSVRLRHLLRGKAP